MRWIARWDDNKVFSFSLSFFISTTVVVAYRTCASDQQNFFFFRRNNKQAKLLLNTKTFFFGGVLESRRRIFVNCLIAHKVTESFFKHFSTQMNNFQILTHLKVDNGTQSSARVHLRLFMLPLELMWCTLHAIMSGLCVWVMSGRKGTAMNPKAWRTNLWKICQNWEK